MTIQPHKPLHWEWRTFTQLSTSELYHLLQLRQQVFVVEQNCPYLDADGLDEEALHLLCKRNDEAVFELVGYLRILAPGKRFNTPVIGRLATAASVRGQGIGRELMEQALQLTQHNFPGQPVTISAQCYLEKFYTSLGFTSISAPYDEDGILHVDMRFLPVHSHSPLSTP